MLKLREITKKDWQFILDVRNQDYVRPACHDTKIITWDEHEKYMEKIKEMPQWIIQYENEDIGYCKIVNGEFGFMILKKYEGRCIGEQIYYLVFDKCVKLGIKSLKDVCRIENIGSIFIAKRVGFEEINKIEKDGKPYAIVLMKHFT